MHHHRFFPRHALVALALTFATVGGIAVGVGPATAQTPAPLPAGARTDPPRSSPARVAAYMVQLAAPPAAVAATTARRRGASVAQAAQQARQQRSDNVADQARVLRTADDRDLVERELYRVDTAYNGVAVIADPGDVARLRAIADVRAVVPLPRHERGNATSVPFVTAPAAWRAAPGGYAGQGVRIGVIDSGIDYVHRTFAGSGSASDLSDARNAANNPAASTTGPTTFRVRSASGAQLFPSERVAGGFDFAGDAYDASTRATAVPRADPNPMDCPLELGGGHGTHVAGTAGGSGVDANGQVAPWQTAWPVPSPMVGTGVAPASKLYGLRVFGCEGSSNLVPLAIDWALDPNRDGNVADRLDVLNLSLGSPFGNQEDPSAVAVQNASAAGVVVVVSAGNSGDQTYLMGSPAVAPRTVAVANMVSKDALAGTVASSSSRGPSGGGGLKPDLAAPGTAISSARSGAGTGAVTFSGTSMSAPHVAGAMAIVRQRRPTWTVEELKAAVLNTAAPDLYAGGGRSGAKHLPSRIGTGTLDVAAAITTEAVAFADGGDGAVGVSFGPLQVPVGTPFRAERTIAVVNRSGSAVSYAARFDDRNPVPGVHWEVVGDGGGPTVTVPAGERRTITLRLSVDDPAQLRNRRDPTLQPTQAGHPRRWLAEATGLVRLTAAERPTLSVAAHASVRPAAATRAASSSVGVAPGTTSGSFNLVGSTFATGGTTEDFQARRTVLEHQATSPRRAPRPGEPELGRADIKHVGIAQSSSGAITFGLALWDRLPAPADFAEIEIEIDRDRDGSVEYVVYPSRLSGTDVFVTCVWRVATGSQTDCFHAPSSASPAEGGTFDTDVLTMSVTRASIGLESPGVVFDYTVSTWGAGVGGTVDRVGPLSWGPDAPGVRYTANPLTVDAPGSVSFRYDAGAAATYGSRGALVLHHLGGPQMSAETVQIAPGLPQVTDPPADAPPAEDPPIADPPVVAPPPADPPVTAPPFVRPPAPVPPPVLPTPPPPAASPPAPSAPPSTRPTTKRCRVPRVTGRSLSSARKRLSRAGCRTGKVSRPKARIVRGKRVKLRPLVVHRQSIRPGLTRKAGTKVALRLRERPRR